MKMQGINVLIDGYNLEIPQGTGIKTYGITLVKALTSLGANVDLLCSRYVNKNHPILIESSFFDQQNTNRHNLKIKTLISTAFKKINPAKEVILSDFVIKQEGDFIFDHIANSGRVFNIYDCYKTANSLYKYLQIETRFKAPEKVDIWHTTYPLPVHFNKTKKVTTIHDLIPLKLPYTTLDDKKFFFNITRNAIEKSDLILTISENTKKDILRCFDVREDKINVTFQPIIDNSLLIKEEELYITLKKYRLQYKKYILFVGTIEPKKNVGRLIDAYSSIDTDMQLAIVGKKGWLWKDEIGRLGTLFEKNFPKEVKLLEYLPTRDLPYLYKGAFCFVFPSLYEGFGLPPLEAMSLGCPVITSNVSSLPEVCGDAAIYVDPYDFNDIRKGIETLINNPDLSAKLIKAGRERINFFSMENYINRLYNAYSQII